MNVTDFPELRNVCNYKEYTQNPPLRTQTWGLGYPSTMLTALVTESRDRHGIKRAWYSPFFRYFSWFENKSFSFLNLKMRQARQALLPPLMLLSRQVCHLSTLHSSKFFDSENWRLRTSLLVQWFGLHALTAEGMGSIPSQGTQIPQAAWHSQKKKKPTETALKACLSPVLLMINRLVRGAWGSCSRERKYIPGENSQRWSRKYTEYTIFSQIVGIKAIPNTTNLSQRKWNRESKTGSLWLSHRHAL